MKYFDLNKDEEKLEKDFSNEKFKSTLSKSNKNRYQSYAKNTLNKSRNINIRLTEKDLTRVKSKAVEKGIPYQTLISSLLHQYANDKINNI